MPVFRHEKPMGCNRAWSRVIGFLGSCLLWAAFIGACASTESPDAGVPSDNGKQTQDSGLAKDAGRGRDSGTDGAIPIDSGGDVGVNDTGPSDGGSLDGGPLDGGPLDSGFMDGGLNDSGFEMDVGVDGGTIDAGQTFTLSVGTSTGGRIFSSPSGIDCGAGGAGPCSAMFESGAQVVLTASAAAGFELSHWLGDCRGRTSTQAVAMTMDRSCWADFIQLNGQVALIPPPASVVPNDTQDNNNILVFLEQSNFVLPQDYPLDVTVPGRWTVYSNDRTSLPAGLVVNIYYVHFDPVTSTNPVATLTFPHEIYGVQASGPALFEGDAISGHPSVLYPAVGTHPSRQLELTGQDEFTLHPDRTTISINYNTTISSDSSRIVTVVPGDVVPNLVSDQIAWITPPGSVVVAATRSSSVTYVFDESGPVVLNQDLAVDITQPAHYASAAALTPGTIASGSTVSATLIHFDPPGSANLAGSLRFDRPVLALIIRSSALRASDFLGAPGTIYPSSAGQSGLELASNERVLLSPDGRSLWFQFAAGSATDQLRVIFAR